MYKSSLRHIHDPVLSSLKMKGILFFQNVHLGKELFIRESTSQNSDHLQGVVAEVTESSEVKFH
jgi:hypothetical protein